MPDIEIKFSTKHLPLEYKLLEFRLMINNSCMMIK